MKKSIYFIFLLSFLLVNCRAYKELKALQTCNFKAISIENIQLAGYDLKSKKNITDFSFLEIGKIGKDYTEKKLILSYTIPIQAQNPNQKLAAMNRLEWKLMLDEIEILNGISNSRVEIPAQQSTTFPLNIKMNITDILSQKSLQELQELAFNLIDEHKKGTRLKLKVKPYLRVGEKQLRTPVFMNVDF